MRFLSEPSGGSDVAGALTSATRDGDGWILSGSKVWTTGAWWSDWALCLARTDWDVAKHAGLTVFILPIHQPSIDTLHRIEMLNRQPRVLPGVPERRARAGRRPRRQVNDGWTVGTRWMFHERMSYNSPLVTFPVDAIHGVAGGASTLELARRRARRRSRACAS